MLIYSLYFCCFSTIFPMMVGILKATIAILLLNLPLSSSVSRDENYDNLREKYGCNVKNFFVFNGVTFVDLYIYISSNEYLLIDLFTRSDDEVSGLTLFNTYVQRYNRPIQRHNTYNEKNVYYYYALRPGWNKVRIIWDSKYFNLYALDDYLNSFMLFNINSVGIPWMMKMAGEFSLCLSDTLVFDFIPPIRVLLQPLLGLQKLKILGNSPVYLNNTVNISTLPLNTVINVTMSCYGVCTVKLYNSIGEILFATSEQWPLLEFDSKKLFKVELTIGNFTERDYQYFKNCSITEYQLEQTTVDHTIATEDDKIVHVINYHILFIILLILIFVLVIIIGGFVCCCKRIKKSDPVYTDMSQTYL